jgi:pyruvate dehydrogenase (quinone)
MVCTDFPYTEFYLSGKTVVQIDADVDRIGRRHPVDIALAGDAGLALRALLPQLKQKSDTSLLDDARSSHIS